MSDARILPSEKCHICGDDPVFMQFCSAPHTQRTSNGLSEADQREAAWSNFCRETPVHLRGPWEAFVWAWEARKHSTETGVGEIERLRETVQRYVEHHEHCNITAYHGVREKSALSRVFDLTSELRRYFESGTLNEASDLYLLLQEIEAMKAPAQKALEQHEEQK